MGKASIECAEVTSRWRIFAAAEGLGPQREAAVASQPAPNSLGYYVVRLKTAEVERQIKMNLWDLTEAFNNLHAAITKSILLSFWEIRRKKFAQTFLSIFSGAPLHPLLDAARLNWRENETKKVVGFENFSNDRAFVKRHWNMIREPIERRGHQNWCRNYDVKQVSFRLGKWHRQWHTETTESLGSSGRERESTRKYHSFRSECSVRCFGCAFLLCADFIDYMKRIQIAAQECNIRFLNPIVGAPEKRAPQCGYIHTVSI